MTNIKQKLEKELPLIIEKSYQQTCYYFKIIPTKRAVFKGFFGSEIYQAVLNNQEILANLGVDNWQKKAFEKALKELEISKNGISFPADRESWIIFNPFYYQAKYSPELIVELVETVAHEIAHAVLFNIDIWQGHNFPHEEITKHIKNHYLQSYDWEKIVKSN
jgi:hypothetical protein